MEWLETIRLRTSRNQDQDVSHILTEAADGLAGLPGLRGIEAYCEPSSRMDFSLQLFWNTDEVQLQGSAPGLTLVREFKDLGLVNHMIWVRLEPTALGPDANVAGHNRGGPASGPGTTMNT